MKYHPIALALVVASVVTGVASRLSNQQSCASIGAGDGPKRLQRIKESLASSESDALRYRQAFGLVGVDSGSVVAVSDTITCSAVTASIDAEFRNPVRGGPFFVARAGARYVAFEPDAEPQPLFYVDTNFTYIGGTP
jgi:hypothetical protein